VPLYIALCQTLITNIVTFSISVSLYCPPPDPHNKHSIIQHQFLSLCTSQQLAMPSRLTVVLVTPAVIFWSSSYQNITAGVANSSFVLSLYTVPTVQSQTAINHTLSLFSSQLSPASSLSTLTQHLPSLVQTLWRSSLLLTPHKKTSRSDLWDERWKQTLLRVALLRKAHF